MYQIGEVQARFITWYAALAGRLSHAGETDEALTGLDGAWDNLMAAAAWSMETRPGEAATILAAIAPLVGFWRPIGPFLEVAQDADLDADGRGELQASLALALAQAAWRRVVASAITLGIPVPAFSSALAWYDGYRSAQLPANLLQAQRDYFGAHTYERVDRPRGEFFHTNWTGRGGTTASSSYNV